MRPTGYYKVNYYGDWIVLEYVQMGTNDKPRYQWAGTHEGAIVHVSESELFEIGAKIEF